ncbi:MAG TPA: nucleotide exchange factor GrpE [Terriglobales bacterium]|nr:nucleotide exchange factor GrpE [Terriglobales bacterium]
MADKTNVNEPVELENDAHPQNGETSSETASKAPAAASVEPDSIKKLQAERDMLYDRLARQQAEFENLRKRTEREKQDFREYALADTLRSMLPILDNFNLALRVQGSGDDLRKGVELIRKQMEDTLLKLGLQPVVALGGPFDPRLHEAIEMVESSDVEDDHVMEELQQGYKFKDRLLRPAMVRVAKNPKK